MADERELGNERERELWLGGLLDAAAEEYEPDAERLKAMVAARIAQQSEDSGPLAVPARTKSGKAGGKTGVAGPRRRGLGLVGRLGPAGIPAGVALATIGAAAAIAVGATATIAVTSSHNRHTITVAAPTTSPGAGGASSPSPGPSEGASPATTGASTHPATSGGPSTGTVGSSTGPALVSVNASVDQGSNAEWAQLDVVVTIKQPLTALHVTVKVSKCAGLASTGAWNSGAGGQFTEATATDSGGSITYEFELAQGTTVSPETLTFAVQFSHASSGWKPAYDTYYVSSRTSTSTSASSVSGSY